MNESAWLTSSDPAAMLSVFFKPFRAAEAIVAPKISDRKLRLFACACCRAVWSQLTDARSRKAVEVAEQYADGLATADEVDDACWLAQCVVPEGPPFEVELAWRCASNIPQLTENAGLPRWFSVSTKLASAQATLLRDIVGNPWKMIRRFGHHAVCDHTMLELFEITPAVLALAQAAYDDRPGRRCETCKGRGEFFRPSVGENDCCRHCHGSGTIADGTLNADRLAILADALEDAGCDHEELLRHLRGEERCPKCNPEGDTLRGVGWSQDPNNHILAFCAGCQKTKGKWGVGSGWVPLRGPHVRGCWALDLLLGKD